MGQRLALSALRWVYQAPEVVDRGPVLRGGRLRLVNDKYYAVLRFDVPQVLACGRGNV